VAPPPPFTPDPASPDSDHDGITDSLGLALGYDPTSRDSDGDGHLDGEALLPTGGPDTDHDGLGDALEAILGTDAHAVDSDGDGFADGLEHQLGSDPSDRSSTPLDPAHLDARVAELLHLAPAAPSPITAVPLDARTVAHPVDALATDHLAADHLTADHLVAGDDLHDATASTTATGDAGHDGAESATESFVDHALAQSGDAYVWGVEDSPDDADPHAFDCSELVQWAASQVGVTVPDGSWIQYLYAQEHGTTMSVDQALHTRGALLFSFSSEPTPGGARPTQAHVAISLGDGTTIEARGKAYGVGSWDAGHRFAYAATIPGLDSTSLASLAVTSPMVTGTPGDGGDGIDATTGTAADHLGAPGAPGADGDDPGAPPDLHSALLAGPDADHDGLTDALEAILGTEVHDADTDHDGISDAHELLVDGTDPLHADTDHDGLTDAQELALGFDPTAFDSDGDGHADSYGLVDLGGPDSDGDGLSDALEAILGTDPNAIDTDHDGFTDGLEFQLGSDPFSADSTPPGLDPMALDDSSTLHDASHDAFHTVDLDDGHDDGSHDHVLDGGHDDLDDGLHPG
jgi:cell wall-associated NlpC family hydrolase